MSRIRSRHRRAALRRWRPLLIATLCACTAGGAAVNAGELQVRVRETSGRLLEDAVVIAEPVGRPPPPPDESARARIDQVNKAFVPLVSVLRSGTLVSFPNSDNIRHSIYSFSPAKTFSTKLYSGRQAPPERFDTAGVVVLGCHIHDLMAAWVVVVDTPWFAKADAAGLARLGGLEPGEYRVRAWYPGGDWTDLEGTVRIAAEGVIQRELPMSVHEFPLDARRQGTR